MRDKKTIISYHAQYGIYGYSQISEFNFHHNSGPLFCVLKPHPLIFT